MSHLHEQVEESHVYTAKETVDLAMGGFVEIAMVPKSVIALVEVIWEKTRVEVQHTFRKPRNIDDRKRYYTSPSSRPDRA